MTIKFIKGYQKDEFTYYRAGVVRIVFDPHALDLIRQGIAVPVDDDTIHEVLGLLDEQE